MPNLLTSPANSEEECLRPNNNLTRTGLKCPRHWDHLLCWPESEAGARVSIPCQASKAFVEIVIASRPETNTKLIPGLAYQDCNDSGSWSPKTDYEECTNFLNGMLGEEETRLKVRHAVSVITFALCLASAVLLLVALGVFTFFKSLKCDRLKVHKNFMFALMIRYVVSVIYYEPYIYGKQQPHVWFRDVGEGYLCKLVLVLLMYGYVAPVFWMFIEGVYLHSRVVTNVFENAAAPFKFYYLVGWCLPFICVVSWGTTMAFMAPDRHCENDSEDNECQDTQTCWEGYTQQPYAYILSVPMTLALTINLLFLINIVRVVLLKSQGPSDFTAHSDGAHIKKALRATIILFPLLGITNLLFFINPKNGTHDKIYMLFNATMQSSQGIFLAILYCFLNSEVQEAIKRQLQRNSTRNDIYREARGDSFKFRTNRRRMTMSEGRELQTLHPYRYERSPSSCRPVTPITRAVTPIMMAVTPLKPPDTNSILAEVTVINPPGPELNGNVKDKDVEENC